MVEIVSIVAVAENGVIGKENQLPWRLKEDLKYFKRVTMGSPVIMGRKTYDSIGRPLPGRQNIVVTRQMAWGAEGVDVAHSVDEAIGLALKSAESSGAKSVFIMGGAQLYEQALKMSTKLYLTKVHAEVEGDAFFPDLNDDEWVEESCVSPEKIDGDSHSYSFVVLKRK